MKRENHLPEARAARSGNRSARRVMVNNRFSLTAQHWSERWSHAVPYPDRSGEPTGIGRSRPRSAPHSRRVLAPFRMSGNQLGLCSLGHQKFTQ